MSGTATTLPDVIDIVSPSGGRRIQGFSNSARLLGKGGSGNVYDHPELPGEAVKLYKEPQRAAEHASKVEAMLSAAPPEVHTASGVVQMAWPQATVLVDGRFGGFVMPRIDLDRAWPLKRVIDPALRRRYKVPERMQLRVYTARNLIFVLQALHNLGHYFVDLKPQNIFVYSNEDAARFSYVALIDCDGFQIRDRYGKRFFADLATPEFLHPDVAVISEDQVDFDEALINELADVQDNFALAVILFQLLNNGLHPMHGVETGLGPVPASLASRLSHDGKFYPYALRRPNPLIKPMPDSLHKWFDPELRALFDRAFAGGSRPPLPAEWLTVFNRLQGEEYHCHRADEHWKLGPTCGQCAIIEPVQDGQRVLGEHHSPATPGAVPTETGTTAPPQPAVKMTSSGWKEPQRWVETAVVLLGVWGLFHGTVPQRSSSANQAIDFPTAQNTVDMPAAVQTNITLPATVSPLATAAPTSSAPQPETAPNQVPSPAQPTSPTDQSGPSLNQTVATIVPPVVSDESQNATAQPDGVPPETSPDNGISDLAMPPGQADENSLGLSYKDRRHVQLALQRLGLLADGTIDGQLGPQTRAAISAYQQQQSQTATGYLNASEWSALEQIKVHDVVVSAASGNNGRGTNANEAVPPSKSLPSQNQVLRNTWLTP